MAKRAFTGRCPITSIAVLPLDNIMGDPAKDYFVDGMHDALITELQRISALTVRSRTSVLRYRENPKPIPEIAEELNVDGVVEGSVMYAEGQVRITAQLIEAAKDRHLWGDSYERDLVKVMALQREVARAIAHQIKITLTPEEETHLTAIPPDVNPAAYELYLKGWHYRLKRSKVNVIEGVACLEQSVALDPGFAPA